MNTPDIATQIEDLQKQIIEKQTEINRKCARRIEISRKPDSPAKRRIIARYKTEIMHLTYKINNLNANLWGLQEANMPES